MCSTGMDPERDWVVGSWMNRITHVAIIFRGVTYSLPAPSRHHHVIWWIVANTDAETVDDDEQGFLDEAGAFLTREAALTVALAAGQVKDPSSVRGGVLFSEDVW